MDFQKYAEVLVRDGYTETEGDPFTIETYEFFQNLRKDLTQKILVTENGEDFICEKCPEKKKSTCLKTKDEDSCLYGSIFWNENMSSKGADRRTAEKSGLEVGKEYTVEEIIKSTKEQTREYMSAAFIS